MSTILFVDDHHAFRTVFAEILRGAGHMVLEAGTVEDAEHLVSHRPGVIDLLIVEAVLSTTNGIDVMRHIQPSYPNMKVLFISEETPETLVKERAVPKGARFLQKPFDAERLFAGLRQLEEAGAGVKTRTGGSGR